MTARGDAGEGTGPSRTVTGAERGAGGLAVMASKVPAPEPAPDATIIDESWDPSESRRDFLCVARGFNPGRRPYRRGRVRPLASRLPPRAPPLAAFLRASLLVPAPRGIDQCSTVNGAQYTGG